ncbi:hypothetical protein NDU88_006489 [Pleurodeles waltl]|uniref:Uncharacterized protein n=1 Tax=Pleurodeles waltl TaxID=8319 RepID=A0AAV7SPR7_PLEWA|nr:hypothetical protein NDU88_006489 [Pleurodeles waltl]
MSAPTARRLFPTEDSVWAATSVLLKAAHTRLTSQLCMSGQEQAEEKHEARICNLESTRQAQIRTEGLACGGRGIAPEQLPTPAHRRAAATRLAATLCYLVKRDGTRCMASGNNYAY